MQTRGLCPTSRVAVMVALALGVAAAMPAVTADELAARRAKVMEALAPGDVLVLSAGRSIPGAVAEFVADRDFFYLVGLGQEASTLVLARGADGQTSEVLFLPPSDPRRLLWDGWRLAPGPEATAQTGITDTRKATELEAYATAAVAGATRLYHNYPRPEGVDAATGMAKVLENAYASAKGQPPVSDETLLHPRRLTSALRQIKSAREVALLEESIAITCRSLERTIRRIEPGLHEYQAQAMIEAGFRWDGAESLGFPSIVAAGKNATVLHYITNRDTMDDGELVVMDVGALYAGYSADVTRTVPANGRFTPRQRELYTIVLAAQEAGIATVAPGKSIRDVHAAAYKVIADAGYARFFPHSTSHWLGLEVHDIGVYEAPLAPGMVLTVEPGIYIPEESIGIRIEDDVLVTADGHRVLSTGVPRTIEAIEALMAGE